MIGLLGASYFSYHEISEWISPAPALTVKSSKLRKSKVSIQEEMARPVSNFFGFKSAPAPSLPLSAESTEAGVVAEASPSASPTESPAVEEAKNEGEEKSEEVTTPEYSGAIRTPSVEHSVLDSSKSSDLAKADPLAPINQDLGPNGPARKNSNTSSHSYGYYPTVVAAANQSNLTPQDIAILTARPITASFLNTTLKDIAGASKKPGEPEFHLTNLEIPTSRWDKNHGIKATGTTVTIQTVAAPIPVTVNVQFNIQDKNSGDTAVSLMLRPTDAVMTQEVVGSSTYYIYRFNFADDTAKGEAIRHLKLTLVYLITQGTNGLQSGELTQAYPSAPSAFTFERSGFETFNIPWSVPNPTVFNEATHTLLKPDVAEFTINLQ